MIDTARWVLVEAWLSLGLRLRWLHSWEAREITDGLFIDDDGGSRLSFTYLGDGEWGVVRPSNDFRVPGYPLNDAPQLGTETIRHELAHYLVATEEQRRKRNFGLSADGSNGGNEWETRALLGEQVIDAVIRGASRVVSSALPPRAALARAEGRP